MTTTELEQTIIGKSLKQAKAICKELEMLIRPVNIDGKDLIVTCEYNPNRLNVVIEEDRIIKIEGVG